MQHFFAIKPTKVISAPDEDRRIEQPKRCEHSNQDEYLSRQYVENDNNSNTSS